MRLTYIGNTLLEHEVMVMITSLSLCQYFSPESIVSMDNMLRDYMCRVIILFYKADVFIPEEYVKLFLYVVRHHILYVCFRFFTSRLSKCEVHHLILNL